MEETFTTLSVLVVDDEPDAANSMSDLLALRGHAARVAFCVRDALALAAAEPPDVVLLDLQMPEMNGWDLAARLAVGTNPPILIAISGRAVGGDRARSSAAGIPFHFTKPIDPYVVLALLDAMTRGCNSGRRGPRPGSISLDE